MEAKPVIVKEKIVYVIDDDDSVRRAFARLMRSAGLTAIALSSADEFFAEERRAEDSCIIVDIRMPGMTGFDFQQKLNEQGVAIPVIVVSASDDEHIRDYARRLGAVSFFRKPIDDQALLDAVWWAIGR